MRMMVPWGCIPELVGETPIRDRSDAVTHWHQAKFDEQHEQHVPAGESVGTHPFVISLEVIQVLLEISYL